MPTSAARDTAPTGPLPAVFVMLVVETDDRRDRLRAAISSIAPGSRIESANGIADAILRSRLPEADLMVLDRGVDAETAPAWIRQLTRVAPEMTVLVFGDGAAIPVDRLGRVRPWACAERVLSDWLGSRGNAHSAQG